MNHSDSAIKKFCSLQSAVAFISECVEKDDARALFHQLMSPESDDAGFFVSCTFRSLKMQHGIMDLRVRYEGRLFPEGAKLFKLGGHDKELGHIHIDFMKREDNWVIENIWQCL